MLATADLATAAGAYFDASGAYRYWLWRTWQPTAPTVAFIMLNPSTADAEQDDATIRRCCGFARAWGCGRLLVANLFAYRATQPRDLRAAAEPVGSDNDRYLQQAVAEADFTIVAWGNAGRWQGRDRAAIALLGTAPLYCLGRTQQGCPYHPLYRPQTTTIQVFVMGNTNP